MSAFGGKADIPSTCLSRHRACRDAFRLGVTHDLSAMHQRLALAGYLLRPPFKLGAALLQFGKPLTLCGDSVSGFDLSRLFACGFAQLEFSSAMAATNYRKRSSHPAAAQTCSGRHTAQQFLAPRERADRAHRRDKP